MLLVLATLGVLIGYADAQSRIVNGQNTDTTKHPHQVSLEYSSDGATNFRHICGASIISSKWVLTAAHCLEHAQYVVNKFQIATNNGKLSDANKSVYKIARIIAHKDYDPSGVAFLKPVYPNDIALMELTSDIVSDISKPIQLTPSGYILDGKNCTISGWGYTEQGTHDKVIPDTLQETWGTIYTRAQCESVFNNILSTPYGHAVHVCIHNANTGSCNGDSGGPMVCDGMLAGVTSWGMNGCTTSSPSVYVRVPNYIAWIQQNMVSSAYVAPTLF